MMMTCLLIRLICWQMCFIVSGVFHVFLYYVFVLFSFIPSFYDSGPQTILRDFFVCSSTLSGLCLPPDIFLQFSEPGTSGGSIETRALRSRAGC